MLKPEKLLNQGIERQSRIDAHCADNNRHHAVAVGPHTLLGAPERPLLRNDYAKAEHGCQ